MILYVNGDSNSSGAELIQDANGKYISFKGDDSLYWYTQGTPEAKQAHPDCIQLSYGAELARQLNAELICDAVPGCSNARILRTTLEYIKHNVPDLIVIGWSTWERDEWLYQDQYYQITLDHDPTWPTELQDRYKAYVADIDYVREMIKYHDLIWDLHCVLESKHIPHLFFTGYFPFQHTEEFDWEGTYIDPYENCNTYYYWCERNGFKTIRPGSYHYGINAQQAWAKFLHGYICQNILTS